MLAWLRRVSPHHVSVSAALLSVGLLSVQGAWAQSGSVMVVAGPVVFSNNNNVVIPQGGSCPTTKPAASAVASTDSEDVVWWEIGPIGSPSTVTIHTTLNGQALTDPQPVTFGSTGNYFVCSFVFPNGNPGNWTVQLFLNGSSSAQIGSTVTFSTPLPSPAISPGGVTNAASYVPGTGSPGLAQGSLFSIFGSALAAGAVIVPGYPLPTTLGNVSVAIQTGGKTYNAYMVFVSGSQINAVLPSNVPLGPAQLTVTSNGATSAPMSILVAATSLGVFFQKVGSNSEAIAQNYVSASSAPLNSPSQPAMPGQIVIVWGTGLGAVNVPDNQAPPGGDMTNIPVTITVAGVPAQRLYAGRAPGDASVDNVYFTVPQLPSTAFGCQVPVAITAAGVAANVANIAVTANGAPCQ